MSLLGSLALGAVRIAPVAAGAVASRRRARTTAAAADRVQPLLDAGPVSDRVRTATQLSLMASGVADERIMWTKGFLASDEGQAFVRAVSIYALGSLSDQARTLSALKGHGRALMALYERAEVADHEIIAGVLLEAVDSYVREVTAQLAKKDQSVLRLLKAEARQASRDGHLTQASYLEPRNRKLLTLSLVAGPDISSQVQEYAERAASDFSRMSIPTLGRPIFANTAEAIVIPRLSERNTIDDAVLKSYLPEAGGSLSGFLCVMQRTILIGNGGGGKSTIVRAAALELALKAVKSEGKTIPFVVTLRQLAAHLRARPTSGILQFLGEHLRENWGVEMSNETLRYLLHVGRAAVFFDGLDEVLAIDERHQIAERIWRFADGFPASFMIVTSRSEGYEEAPVPGFSTEWRLHSFDETQIATYTGWLLAEQDAPPTRDVEHFMHESRGISDLRSNPLMLGILATLYGYGRSLPSNRELLYSKCAEMIFSEWDYSKGLTLELEDQDSVSSAIKALAWNLFKKGVEEVSETELRTFLEQHFVTSRGLGQEQAIRITREALKSWKGRQWILVFVGERQGEAYFRFSHRSFLEYFAAAEVVFQASSARKLWRTISALVRERAATQFCLLAAEMHSKRSANSGPKFLTCLMNSARTSEHDTERFTLLLFAFECLPVVRSDAQIRSELYDLYLDLLSRCIPENRVATYHLGYTYYVVPPVFKATYTLQDSGVNASSDEDEGYEQFAEEVESTIEVDHLALPIAWCWASAYEVSRGFEDAVIRRTGNDEIASASKLAHFCNTISQVSCLQDFPTETLASIKASGRRIWAGFVQRSHLLPELTGIGTFALGSLLAEDQVSPSTAAARLGRTWLFMAGAGVTTGPDADRHAPACDLVIRVLKGEWDGAPEATVAFAETLLRPLSPNITCGEYTPDAIEAGQLFEVKGSEASLILAILLVCDDHGGNHFVDQVLKECGQGLTGYASIQDLTWLEKVLWTIRIPTLFSMDTLLEDEGPDWLTEDFRAAIDERFIAHARH